MAKKVQNLVPGKKYEGKYVALDGRKVIASSIFISKVYKSARSQGHELPTIVYVPKKQLDK